MRRLTVLTTLVLGLALAAASSASGGFVFSFTGSGWGHGVGMAQWGAYGFAKQGWTYDRILAHYYTGTTLGPSPVQRIRVLLASDRGRVSISSQASFVVSDADTRVRVPAGTITLGTSLVLEAGGKEHELKSPIRVQPGAKPLSFERAYRGAMVVSLVGGKLSVVNDVDLDEYVYAIVPHEMPYTWDAEALKVQAVAARTYAIKARKTGTYYDFRSDPVAQAYEGVEEENARTTQAVEATAGQIVLYQGQPVWTFYSSSSGGRTATLKEAFPGGEDLPYLQSVEDPYDTLSPHHAWGPVRFTAEDLAGKLGLPGPPERIKLRKGPSGRVITLVVRGPGWVKEVPGSSLRSSLGLRSTLVKVSRQAQEAAR